MAKHGQGNIASKRSSRRNRIHAEMRVQTERYSTLLSRSDYTFSRMRIDRGGPRTRSAICFPGWIRA
jgi:hypothetical protein